MREGFDGRNVGGTATECRNCGAHVTRRFARVMGNNDDEVYGCPRCLTLGELMSGASHE